MRTTITIDDILYAQALELADSKLNKPSKIFEEALKTFVRVEAAKRLAAMGGIAPDTPPISNPTVSNKSHK